MSTINSPVAAVEALRFNELPSKRRVAVVAAVRVDRTTVFVDAKGNVYRTQVKKSCFYTFGSGFEDTLEGCRRLGLLSKEAVDKHNAAVAKRNETRDRRYAAGEIERCMAHLGLELTPEQRRAVDKAAKR